MLEHLMSTEKKINEKNEPQLKPSSTFGLFSLLTLQEQHQQIKLSPAVDYHDSKTQEERMRELNLFSLKNLKVKEEILTGTYYYW